MGRLIRIGVSEAEYDVLTLLANKKGKTLDEYARQVLIGEGEEALMPALLMQVATMKVELAKLTQEIKAHGEEVARLSE